MAWHTRGSAINARDDRDVYARFPAADAFRVGRLAISTAILNGIRIVDLSDGIAGPTATMVLAEAGADVVLVEPVGGVGTRGLPGFKTWNRSKQSVQLDIADSTDRKRFNQLLAGADVLVHSYSPLRARELGIDDASLAAEYPNLIACSVLAWPANHPDADQPVDDLLALARMGVLDEQKGLRDGPIYVRFPLGSWGAVWLAAIGIMARLIVRGRTGKAGPAHTSLVQGALIPMMMHWSRAETPSDNLRIGMPKDNMSASLFECSDGQWIHVMPPAPDDTPLMQEVWAEMGPDAVAAANATMPNWSAAYPNAGANKAAYLRRPAQAWLDNAWANDKPAQGAWQVGAILQDEQARTNRYVIELDDPEAGKITVPGLPLTIDPPTEVRSPAPALGQHQDEAGIDWTPRPSAATTNTDQRWPLAGMKVLDFGNYLAGPLGPMLLADLGADVIKVEATIGDPMRWGDWPFAGCQRGKRTVAVNLKSPESRPVLEALVKWADVVHHNLRKPAARKLGLDSEALRKINPDLVFCHTSSYGPEGLRADWPGYDQLFQSSCGWEVAGAGEGNPPMWHRFGFMDHQCAMSSVVSTLLAVFERDRTGRATDAAGSLLGPGVLTTSETYLQSDGTLAPMIKLDKEQMVTTPGARLLICSDGWVAVAAHRDDQVARLCQALGSADPDGLPAAAAERKMSEVLDALAEADVPAEEVRLNNKAAFFDDPDNRAAGLVVEYQHRVWGKLEQPGAMWDFGDLETRFDYAPPVLGEHTEEVLREIGFADPEIKTLLAAEVVKSA
ncbi:CoA transferase [Jatrophihabitans sp. DSM 45814]